MVISNKEIANIFLDFAENLEKAGENPYRIRAYRRAAKSIIRLSNEISDKILLNEDLTHIPNVGKRLAQQIKNIIQTGHLIHTPKKNTLRNSRAKLAYNDLKYVKWIGPKRIIQLKKMGITSKVALLKAIQQSKLKNVKGFSNKIQKKIEFDIEHPTYYTRKLKLFSAVPIVENLLNHLKEIDGVILAKAVGSYRRKVDMIDQLDILIMITNSHAFKKILMLDEIKAILDKKHHYVKVIINSGILVNLYFVNNHQYAINELILTGSPSHLQHLQQLTINQQSLTDIFVLPKYNEEKIYRKLKLDYIEPELREDRGEIEAASHHKLPKLIQLRDIRGDLHCHTWETDGTESLETMVQAAIDLGYEYLAITDHSKHLAITHGLDEERLLNQIKLIDRLNNKFPSITILKSIEVDILADGTLDLSDSVLKELDLCVCSIHSKFKLDEEKQTERIIRAMDNPYFNILGHATGRILNYRQSYPLNVEKICKAAKERNCFIELNAQPSRLDINDLYCQMAKKMGVKIAISSDAHSVRELNFMQYGIYQARRGWLEPADVINTRSLAELKKLIKRT